MFTGCDKIVRKAEDIAESEDANDMAIWVSKLSGGPGQDKWQKRFLVVRGGYLEYYDTDKHIHSRLRARKPKGAIPLLYVNQITNSRRYNGFKLVTRRRTFDFKAATEADNQKCIYDLQCAKRWCMSNSHLIKEHQLSTDAQQDMEVLKMLDDIDKRNAGEQDEHMTRSIEQSDDFEMTTKGMAKVAQKEQEKRQMEKQNSAMFSSVDGMSHDSGNDSLDGMGGTN